MRNGYFGIGLTIAITFGVMVFFQLMGSIGVLAAYGINEESWDSQGVLLINSFAQIVAMGGGAWLVTAGAKQNISEIFRLDPSRSRASIPIYILLLPLVFVAQTFGAALASLWMHLLSLSPELFESLQEMQEMLDSSMRKLVIADTPARMVTGLISIAVVPAMCEELFFRGFALGNIERSGQSLRTRTAIVISSVVFGLSHLSPFNIPAIIVLGLIFGWLLVKTDDMRVTMTAHFLNNGIIVVALFLLGSNREISDALLSSEALPVIDSLVVVGISGIILLTILSYIGKLASRNE